eukprot:510120-Karenia_brevis.AAC.1
MWTPLNRSICVGGLKIQGSVVLDPRGIAEGMASHFRAQFMHSPLSPKAAFHILNQVGAVDWEWNLAEPITPLMYERMIESLFDSAAGVDGVPYSGFAADPKRASRLFYKVKTKIVATTSVPDGFNYILTICLTKKPDEFNDFGAV